MPALIVVVGAVLLSGEEVDFFENPDKVILQQNPPPRAQSTFPLLSEKPLHEPL
ncbi:Hypothetical protein FKW44_021744 [Caligus rogercresseyi]|uniref:Uncharacterized protein n=1 Tax=Caligus rogercresseyi TaxID=217165 RepID=A0A7T8JWM1_CALRO|nr:Hypothetical protein FKW44_021744 [Caligus rogercresseyi]